MRLSILLPFILLGCSSLTAPSSSSSNQDPSFQLCSEAALHLTALCQQDIKANEYCCQVVAPTKLGKSFAQFCREKESEGIDVNAICLAQVGGCSEIDQCTGSQEITHSSSSLEIK